MKKWKWNVASPKKLFVKLIKFCLMTKESFHFSLILAPFWHQIDKYQRQEIERILKPQPFEARTPYLKHYPKILTNFMKAIEVRAENAYILGC